MQYPADRFTDRFVYETEAQEKENKGMQAPPFDCISY